MPESKLGEKWMYYDWSQVDRCFPLSVRLSLFVQGEISSRGHSAQLLHLHLYVDCKICFSFTPFSLVPSIFFLYLCLCPLSVICE